MQMEPRIVFRDVERSPSDEELIRAKVAKLDGTFPRIVGCDVLIEKSHQHSQRGQQYHVRINLAVPRRQLIVDRKPDARHQPEDLGAVVRDCFGRMQRQLDEYARELNGEVKTH